MTDHEVETLTEVKTIVTDMHHRLFGNGQPGIVSEYNTRLATLEAQKHRVEGAIRFVKFSAVITPVIAGAAELYRLWLKG